MALKGMVEEIKGKLGKLVEVRMKGRTRREGIGEGEGGGDVIP